MSSENSISLRRQMVVIGPVVIYLFGLPAAFHLDASEPAGPHSSEWNAGMVRVSSGLIDFFLSRQLEYTREVDVAGRPIGTATSTANMTTRPVHNGSAGTLQLNIDGRLDWQMKGTAGNGVACPPWTYLAKKRITISAEGIVPDPAVVVELKSERAETVDADDSILCRLKRGAGRMQDRQVRQRIERQLDHRVQEALQVVRGRFTDQPWVWAAVLTALMSGVQWTSTADGLIAAIAADAGNTFVPRDSCPLNAELDAQIVLHESAVQGFARHTFGNHRLQDVQLAKHIARMRGKYSVGVMGLRASCSLVIRMGREGARSHLV